MTAKALNMTPVDVAAAAVVEICLPVADVEYDPEVVDGDTAPFAERIVHLANASGNGAGTVLLSRVFQWISEVGHALLDGDCVWSCAAARFVWRSQARFVAAHPTHHPDPRFPHGHPTCEPRAAGHV